MKSKNTTRHLLIIFLCTLLLSSIPVSAALYRKTTQEVTVYSAANAAGSVVTTVPKGATVELIGQSKKYSNWFYIGYGDYKGFVDKQYLIRTTSTEEMETTRTIAASVQLRSSTNILPNNIVRLLSKGESVTIVTEGSNWHKIRTSDGTEGYVPNKFVGTAPVSLTNSVRVALRSSAVTKKGNIMKMIPKGKTVQVLSSSGNWYQVTYGNRTGYVKCGYFLEEGITAPTETASRRLKIFSKMSGGSVIGAIPAGGTATVLKECKNWYRVRFGSVKGYVKAGYFATDKASSSAPDPTDSSDDEPSSGSGTKTVRSDVYLRASTSTSSSILTTLPAGARVTVIGNYSGWTKVTYRGMTGYVGSSFLG